MTFDLINDLQSFGESTKPGTYWRKKMDPVLYDNVRKQQPFKKKTKHTQTFIPHMSYLLQNVLTSLVFINSRWKPPCPKKPSGNELQYDDPAWKRGTEKETERERRSCLFLARLNMMWIASVLLDKHSRVDCTETIFILSSVVFISFRGRIIKSLYETCMLIFSTSSEDKLVW